MLAPSGFSPAHVILVVFATLGESQAGEIARLNFGRALSKVTAKQRLRRPKPRPRLYLKGDMLCRDNRSAILSREFGEGVVYLRIVEARLDDCDLDIVGHKYVPPRQRTEGWEIRVCPVWQVLSLSRPRKSSS
ncbi:MAG: hypothetical protein EOO38_15765 [Cytophagaceae bacterium]|nr:MAG: hypothetical protein EOO38_15765 [Cytophagaceae bacterium]